MRSVHVLNPPIPSKFSRKSYSVVYLQRLRGGETVSNGVSDLTDAALAGGLRGPTTTA